MEFLYEYGLFFAKVITFVIAIIAIIAAIAGAAQKQKHKKGELEIDDLSKSYQDVEDHMLESLLTKDELKQREKDLKKQLKQEKKQQKQDGDSQSGDSRLFVIDFKGSIDAREVESLREEISAVLTVASPTDEVLVRVESGGGMVHGYGLAASQLDRIKQQQVPLTIAVDKVAASGGYMMACVADKIVAAPFAILGSIGVLAQIPNFHKLLKKNDIDFEQLTAGEYKRTLTMFGENTDKGREKFVEELEDTHQLFKQFVAEHRPSLDLDKVATGEHWFGIRAKELGLVDDIQTSDDYLYQAAKDKKVIHVKYSNKKGLTEKLSKAASLSVSAVIDKLWQRNRVFPS
ncbi:protease SohB [Thalassotalea ponticola]|uniref:protease SohB n=1 Tax=Thalassotalea ponticola TaxID=1523392 RepID=UPI0025B3401A|nr:protease SohB [Thalassotalea ponticola]MDN3651564.1 protease SohB [Thalassotalea ponticola]